MHAALYILLIGIGALVLIHVPAYRRGRCLTDWVRALAAAAGGGMVVFFSGSALLDHYASGWATHSWNSDQLVLWGATLVLASGILRFKRTKP
jgi:hypothetical protein